MICPPILSLQQVTQRFRSLTALVDITVQIEAGERVALVGASGAGKSTLIGLMNGSRSPTQGSVWALGHNLNQLSPKRRRQVQRQIGTIYQQFHLVDNLQVIHNVNAGHLGHWPLWKSAASLVWPLGTQTAAMALEKVGIPEKLYTRTDQLSGGQQQRVALARILVQDPAIILADEPIASLDPERSRAIMDLLSQLVQETGKTLVVSLHTVEFAHTHCDRIIGLRQGRIAFDAPAASVTPDMLSALYRGKAKEQRLC